MTIRLAVIAAACLSSVIFAQNVIVEGGADITAPAIKLAENDLSDALFYPVYHHGSIIGPDAQRVAARLDAHVAEFLAGFPYMSFHNTLGISGYEAYFNHPDRMFYALSIASPCLTAPTHEKLKKFLAEQLESNPPYAIDGFENRTGMPREACDVPPNFRASGRGKAANAFGVYALWAYCHYIKQPDAAKAHWEKIKERMRPLLNSASKFDIAKKDYAHDEAQNLNGDLAGAIGLVELSKLNGDAETEKQARTKVLELLEIRVNLERVNSRILDKTNSTTQHLHAAKLARYCDLTPQVCRALLTRSDGCAAKRLKLFREERNGWFMAFGDRYIGGENYTSPPHFAEALFAGAAFIESLDGKFLLSFVDVPWCKGDFYFIEKCAIALWAQSGRPWLKDK